MSITVTDQFCGAGGSSLGATFAGYDLKLAMNHWSRAIETHAANFPKADHAHVDVACVEPDWFPKTDVLLTSPSCTAHSYARGRPKDDPHMWDPRTLADERSRATMWDVPRFAERLDYKLIVVENVPQVIEWGPRGNKGSQFRAWLQAMIGLGYEYRLLYLNAQFFPPAPQSRDRFYGVFWKRGITPPDLDFTPVGWCPECEQLAYGRQTWKRKDRSDELHWGRYGHAGQYTYNCLTCQTPIIPATTPAATAIDWEIEAQRIGDRKRPLKPATLERIRRGLERLWEEQPMIVAVGGNLYERPGYARAWPVYQPMPTATTTLDRGLVVPVGYSQDDAKRARDAGREPFPTQTGRAELGIATVPTHVLYGDAITIDLRGHNRPRHPDVDPLSTVCASGNHHGLIVANYGLPAHRRRNGHPGGWARRADLEPIGTITTTDGHSLVQLPDGMIVPYNRTGVPRDVAEPMPTITTVAPHALVRPDVDVEECGFRMLEPKEIARAMVMHEHADGSEYRVTGTKRDQVKQYGNAVVPPVMRAILERCRESLERAA